MKIVKLCPLSFFQLQAELDGFVEEANDYLHNLTLKEPFNYLIKV